MSDAAMPETGERWRFEVRLEAARKDVAEAEERTLRAERNGMPLEGLLWSWDRAMDRRDAAESALSAFDAAQEGDKDG